MSSYIHQITVRDSQDGRHAVSCSCGWQYIETSTSIQIATMAGHSHIEAEIKRVRHSERKC